MAFFGSLKNSLKQKWLQYFQTNRFWISLHSGAVATPDGGKRPASYLILGIINVLEPQLAELMLPFLKLNPNVDALIEVLGLNFDPDLMLGKDSQSAISIQEDLQVQADDLLLDDLATNDKSVVVISEAESLEGGSFVPKTFQEQDAFTVTSLDEITFDDTPADSVVISSDDFNNVFSDIGNEANLDFEPTLISDFTEDEGQAQDNQDISGLFPNS
jgi:hypothetical protein